MVSNPHEVCGESCSCGQQVAADAKRAPWRALSFVALVAGVAAIALIADARREQAQPVAAGAAADSAPPVATLAVRAGCTLVDKQGVLGILESADVLVIGEVETIFEVQQQQIARVRIERVLRGTGLAAGGTVDVNANAMPSMLPVSARLLVPARVVNGSHALLPGWPFALRLADPAFAGFESLVDALLTGSSPAAALATAATTGGSQTRLLATRDLASRQALVDALTANEVAALAAQLPGQDESLIIVLASRGDASLADPLAACVAHAQGDRVVSLLAQVFMLAHLRDRALPAFDAWLQPTGPTGPADARRRAARVLARLGEDGEASVSARLHELIADADSDVASEAWIGLAGSHDDALADRARDIVRAGLAPRPLPPLSGTPVQQRLESRAIDDARHQESHGPRQLLMAAGYYLARSPMAENRAWLAERVARISDAPARVFLADRVAQPWTVFDTAW